MVIIPDTCKNIITRARPRIGICGNITVGKCLCNLTPVNFNNSVARVNHSGDCAFNFAVEIKCPSSMT